MFCSHVSTCLYCVLSLVLNGFVVVSPFPPRFVLSCPPQMFVPLCPSLRFVACHVPIVLLLSGCDEHAAWRCDDKHVPSVSRAPAAGWELQAVRSRAYQAPASRSRPVRHDERDHVWLRNVEISWRQQMAAVWSSAVAPDTLNRLDTLIAQTKWKGDGRPHCHFPFI